MVRAIKLESTTSGSYLNASQGVFYAMDGGGTPAPAPATDSAAPRKTRSRCNASFRLRWLSSDIVEIDGVKVTLVRG